MRRILKRIILGILLLSLLSISWVPVSAQTGGSDYVEETGHWITGAFYDFYTQTPDAEFLYGYPITESYIDSFGKTVQYFQKARFELANGQVVLSPLGELSYQAGEQADYTATTAACRQEQGWPYPVCFTFLDFFDAHGGETQFGAPISAMEFHGERLMQYFRNARLEWHPENPSGANVTIGNLGSVYFYQISENPALLQPVLNNNVQLKVLDLKVRGFVEKATVSNGEPQVIFVTVHDQNLAPVKDVQVYVQLVFPDDPELNRNLDPALTNSLGFVKLNYLVNENKVGPVMVVITVNYQSITKATETSFRIWY